MTCLKRTHARMLLKRKPFRRVSEKKRGLVKIMKLLKNFLDTSLVDNTIENIFETLFASSIFGLLLAPRHLHRLPLRILHGLGSKIGKILRCRQRILRQANMICSHSICKETMANKVSRYLHGMDDRMNVQIKMYKKELLYCVTFEPRGHSRNEF